MRSDVAARRPRSIPHTGIPGRQVQQTRCYRTKIRKHGLTCTNMRTPQLHHAGGVSPHVTDPTRPSPRQYKWGSQPTSRCCGSIGAEQRRDTIYSATDSLYVCAGHTANEVHTITAGQGHFFRYGKVARAGARPLFTWRLKRIQLRRNAIRERKLKRINRIEAERDRSWRKRRY